MWPCHNRASSWTGSVTQYVIRTDGRPCTRSSFTTWWRRCLFLSASTWSTKASSLLTPSWLAHTVGATPTYCMAQKCLRGSNGELEETQRPPPPRLVCGSVPSRCAPDDFHLPFAFGLGGCLPGPAGYSLQA